MHINKINLTISFFLFLFFSTCEQQDKQLKEGGNIQQLWSEMMVIHDEVMPKMSVINRLKRELQKDSTQLELVTSLTKAENGMWDWMHGLKPIEEIEKMDHSAATTYLKSETEKILSVSDMMKKSMLEAELQISKISAQ